MPDQFVTQEFRIPSLSHFTFAESTSCSKRRRVVSKPGPCHCRSASCLLSTDAYSARWPPRLIAFDAATVALDNTSVHHIFQPLQLISKETRRWKDYILCIVHGLYANTSKFQHIQQPSTRPRPLLLQIYEPTTPSGKYLSSTYTRLSHAYALPRENGPARVSNRRGRTGHRFPE